MKYIKQLDSIRAIAVLIVIIEHWIPDESKIKFFVNGAMGVNIFFVLSGFLITKILIDNKIKVTSGKLTTASFFKIFYIRRSLRIFPIYYLTIFLLLIFHKSTLTDIKPNFAYFLTYTSNFYFYKIQAWDGIVSHLWSLAVEEQFYLLWPFVILFTPKKYLLQVIVLFISIGLVSQYFWDKTEFDHTLVIYCFDCFGIGALLSWIITFKKDKLIPFCNVTTVLGLLSAIILFLQLYKPFTILLSERTLHALVALWIISYIVKNAPAGNIRFGFVFNNCALIFLGKISYGIYIYHLILPTYVGKYLVVLNSHLMTEGTKASLYVFYAENFVILVMFSWLSWKIIEQPVLGLKKYFSYEREQLDLQTIKSVE